MVGLYEEVGEARNVSGRSMVCASVAAVAVMAPLLGMMGFSFLATLTLLLVSSPLLLIFSPLLLVFGLVLAGVLAGFAVAGAMALIGVSALAWIYRQIGGWGSPGFGYGVTDLGDTDRMKVKQEQGKEWEWEWEWANHFQHQRKLQ